MAYTVFNANGTSTVVPDNVIEPTFYDSTNRIGIQLVGRNAIDYGQPIAQNFLQLLENFASPTTPGANGAVAPIGMVWFDTTLGALRVQTSAGTWTSLLSGNQTITVSGDISGSGTTSLVLTLPDITAAGTYKSVTVNAKGQVTAGTNPTTLGGYGITDAQPLDGDLTAIAAIAATSGLLRKTAANTWSLDTSAYLTANQSITISGDVSGSGTTSIPLTLANSGATAGTYGSATQSSVVTVDAKGRITSITTVPISTAATTTLTGDVTGSGVGTVATTLSATGVAAGTYGAAGTSAPVIVVDTAGRITSAASATITPAFSSITGTPTTLAGYGITNAAPINSPTFTGSPSAPTPVQFNNTNNIATTIFVKQAQGNLSGTSSFTISSSIPVNRAGNLIKVTTGTQTLPSIASVADGTTFTFSAFGACTITAAGANTIRYPIGTTVSSVALNAGSVLTLVSDNSVWHIISGPGIGSSGGLINVQTFTSSGTYTPTPGTTSIIVEAVGGGGGSGSTLTGTRSVSAGGAPGAYGKARYTTVTTTSVTVGAGGNGGAAVNTPGGGGSATSFGALLSCPGGPGSAAGYQSTNSIMIGTAVSASAPVGTNIFVSMYGIAGSNNLANDGTTAFAGAATPTPLGSAGAGAAGQGSNGGWLPGLPGFDGCVVVYEYA